MVDHLAAGAIAGCTAVLPQEAGILRLAADAEQVARWRERLCDLSWTMKALKENLARRANHENR